LERRVLWPEARPSYGTPERRRSSATAPDADTQENKGESLMRRIAFASEKGGVGKTTCALNVGVGLAKLGRRVLLVDVDPQGNASLVLTEGQGAESPTLSNVLMGDANALDAIRLTRTPGLDILPTDVHLADAALAIADRIGREGRLRAALADVEGSYDVVVLDTPPTRSLLTVNALCYASEVWIPVEPGLRELRPVFWSRDNGRPDGRLSIGSRRL
jgi:chromosome partitioning protein